MRRRSWWLGIIAVVSLLLCLDRSDPGREPKRGGTLRVSYGNEIAHLDFHTAPGYEMMWVAMNVGCGLVNITPDGKFVGDAAESWQVSPDGLTLHLQAPEERPLPRRHQGRRRRGQVQHRPPDGPRHQVRHAALLRLRAQRRGARSAARCRSTCKQPYAFFLHMLAAYRTGLVLYSPTATQKYSLEDRKQGKPEAVVGLRPLQAGRVGQGQPPGHGPLRQVLRARAALSRPRASSA